MITFFAGEFPAQMASRLRCNRLDSSSGGAAAVTRPGCRPFSGPGQGSGPPAPGVVGGRRRPPASRRGLGTGRAGGPLAAVEGVVQAGALVREMYESIREMYERLGRKVFGATTADGWLAKAAGVVAGGRAQAALEAFWRRLKGWHRQERYTRDGREFPRDAREIGQEILGATRQIRRLAKAARGGGIRTALEAFLRWLKGVTGRSACTRDVREFHESLREIGQKVFGA